MVYICNCTKIAFQLRYFIKLAYKGTNYHGWQYQPNAITIQELVNKALSTLLKSTIEVVGAGRTDAGVHATEYYAHFDFTKEINADELVYKVNAILPNDIVVYAIFNTKEDLHARFDATSRSYEYHIYLGRNPFKIETTWQIIHKKIDVDAMNEAAKLLLNYTNFKSFSRSNTDVKTYNCKIERAEWQQNDTDLIFYITADRFLRNMVRAVVGTLLDVGTGRTSLKEFQKIIESKNRSNAGPSVPAKGLFLTKITYPKNSINE
jgi:tRNA pseudouridine38-40 synthase